MCRRQIQSWEGTPTLGAAQTTCETNRSTCLRFLRSFISQQSQWLECERANTTAVAPPSPPLQQPNGAVEVGQGEDSEGSEVCVAGWWCCCDLVVSQEDCDFLEPEGVCWFDQSRFLGRAVTTVPKVQMPLNDETLAFYVHICTVTLECADQSIHELWCTRTQPTTVEKATILGCDQTNNAHRTSSGHVNASTGIPTRP